MPNFRWEPALPGAYGPPPGAYAGGYGPTPPPQAYGQGYGQYHGPPQQGYGPGYNK